ncbi:hypothetical protein KKA15_03345 [Patescibacteria group bacterium]|nr:hypothetical protein [Patescibacteria group bacterium]
MSIKIDKNYNWVQFSQSYLHQARLSCEAVLSKKLGIAIRYGENSIKERKYKARDIFIPTLFNIKHGIESFIKTLKIILAEKLNKKDLKHNISELFELLKIEIKKHKIVEVIRKEYQDNPESINLEIAYNNKLKIDDILKSLEKLILKYYHCEILMNKLGGSYIIEDISNTAFRYPDNNLKININYDDVLDKVSDDDLLEMLADVNNLLDNFNNLGFVLEVYKQQVDKNKK